MACSSSRLVALTVSGTNATVGSMTMDDLWRIDPEWVERMKAPTYWHLAEQVDGLRMLGVLQRVEPCEHDRIEGHWDGPVCRCTTSEGLPKGRWRDRGMDYAPPEWVECDHKWCEGAALRGNDE